MFKETINSWIKELLKDWTSGIYFRYFTNFLKWTFDVSDPSLQVLFTTVPNTTLFE